MRPPRRRVWGGVTLLLFAALAVWTALSIAWSVQPSDSWQAANLTLSYLAVFAGALALAQVAPARWGGVLGGVVLACVVLCGWSLLAKVFPSISPLDLYARLRAPFDYWNAVGLMAALGIPGCLWLGARRDGHAALSALAVPALGLLLVALMLSYGRGPLLAATVAVACWFAIVPLRLRGLAVLTTAGAGAAVVCAWAFASDALAKDGTPLDVRADAGHSLGLLLLAMVVVLMLAGLALSFAMSRSALSPQGRRALGTGVLIALALVPLAGIGALAASDRGLAGSISHSWNELTDPNAQQPANDPGRLASVGSVRARYWDNGFSIWRKAPWLGVGADGYATARKPIQPDRLRVRHAHGYVPQTLADLGLIGMGIAVALLLAWFGAAAARPVCDRDDAGARRSRAARRAGAPRAAPAPTDDARADRADDARHDGDRVRCPFSRRLDVVRARHRGGRSAVRRLGSRPRTARRRPGPARRPAARPRRLERSPRPRRARRARAGRPGWPAPGRSGSRSARSPRATPHSPRCSPVIRSRRSPTPRTRSRSTRSRSTRC